MLLENAVLRRQLICVVSTFLRSLVVCVPKKLRGSWRIAKHRRSQGVQWVYLHPSGRRKNQAKFKGKIYKAKTTKIFRTFCAGRREIWRRSGLFSSFSLCFEGDDLEKVLNFFEEKEHPQITSWLRLCCKKASK